MIEIKTFFISALLLLSTVVAYQSMPVGDDLFGAIEESDSILLRRSVLITNYAVYGMAKLNHATTVPAYDIGFFGRSDSLSIGARYFRDIGRAFNFSIPASSIYQSISSVNYLKERDVLPKIVVISIPFFEVHNEKAASLPSMGMSVGDRLQRLVSLIGIWGDNEMSANEFLQTMIFEFRSVQSELKRIFDLESLLLKATYEIGLGTAFYRETYTKIGVKIITRDGSWDYYESPEKRALPILVSGPDTPLFIRLRFELEKLIELSSTNCIVLYEAPVESASARHYQSNPSKHALALRTFFQDLAAETNLNFFETTDISPTDTGSDWLDSTHSPGRVISPYINGLIKRACT